MDGAPCIGRRLGLGLGVKVSMSQIDVNERLGKLIMDLHNLNSRRDHY